MGGAEVQRRAAGAIWAEAAGCFAPVQVGVRQFLKIVRVLAWDAEAADFYAEIRHRLTSTGQLIGELDMMIAAHALAAGAVLVTNNVRHFGRMAGALAVVNWE